MSSLPKEIRGLKNYRTAADDPTGRCTTVRGESVHKFRCEVRGDEVFVEV